ncbi:sulfate adenylyltransferase subunit CysD, partial [Burkholderia pseudomallei]
SRNAAQAVTLLETIERHGYTAMIGGARRDEEKARAKERIFSFRDEFGQWDPKAQRPELWSLYNARLHRGEHLRVFPISNWTELDVWQYIAREKLELPSIYYAHRREIVRRNGLLVPVTPLTPMREGETSE